MKLAPNKIHDHLSEETTTDPIDNETSDGQDDERETTTRPFKHFRSSRIPRTTTTDPIDNEENSLCENDLLEDGEQETTTRVESGRVFKKNQITVDSFDDDDEDD